MIFWVQTTGLKMANTYSWDIGDIEVYVEKNGFSNVVWRYGIIFKGTSDTLLVIDADGADNGYKSAYWVLGIELTPPAVEAADFVPFDSLTKQQLYDWGMATTSKTQSEINTELDSALDSMGQEIIENVVIKTLAS